MFVVGNCYLIMVWFELCVLCCLYCYFVCGVYYSCFKFNTTFSVDLLINDLGLLVCSVGLVLFKFFPGGYLFSLNLGCLV